MSDRVGRALSGGAIWLTLFLGIWSAGPPTRKAAWAVALGTASDPMVVADRSKAKEVAGSPGSAGKPGVAMDSEPMVALVLDRNSSPGSGGWPFGLAAEAATGTDSSPTAAAASRAATL